MYQLIRIGIQWYVLNDKGVKIPVESESVGILLIKKLEREREQEKED